MFDPIPAVVIEAGDSQDAPTGAIPVALFGAGGGGSSSTDAITIEGVPDSMPDGTPLNELLLAFQSSIGDLVMSIADLQQSLTSIEGRIEALESAAG